MDKYIFFAFILIMVTSCTEKYSNTTYYGNAEEIRIDTNKGEILRYDSIFTDNVTFVKLETTDENLIGIISDIFFDDNLIFVVDTWKAKSVFIFDMNGTYISKIANYGNGPGEYSLMYNVFFNKNKKEIVVVDTPQHKKIHYSYSGEFLYEERRPFPLCNCESLESGNRAYYIAELDNPHFDNSGNNVMVITDNKDKIIYTACSEFYSEQFNLNQPKDFWKYGNELYFYPNFQNTIFLLTDTAAIAKYYINILPDQIPPPSEIPNVTNNSYLDDYLNRKPHFDGVFIELEDLTYLELVHFGCGIIYSHNTKKTFLINDHINTLYHFFTTPITRYGENTIVVPTMPQRILDAKEFMYVSARKIREKYPDMIIETDKSFLDALYQNLNEEDNPVLFFYELNNNL